MPHDVHALPPEQRAARRVTTRAAFLAYLARGYRTDVFRRGDAHELPYYEPAGPAGMERPV